MTPLALTIQPFHDRINILQEQIYRERKLRLQSHSREDRYLEEVKRLNLKLMELTGQGVR